jgi:16S rRNA (guanine966-N2)-methyltransferase
MFDVLSSLMDITDCHVADLFAGTGALGIEALSRGAASVLFVDNDPRAVRAIRSNLAALGLQDRGRVMRDDAMRVLARPHWFDIALCDPPYDFSGWDTLLSRLRTTVAVLESRRPAGVPVGWETLRHKRYGGTLVTVVRSVGARQDGSR